MAANAAPTRRAMTARAAAAEAGVRVPVLGMRVKKPNRGSLAWYTGLGLMTVLEVIEWPVAVVVGVSHALATHARDPGVREAAAGAEAGT